MLKDRDSSAIVAVTDIEEARTFYQDRMGLTLASEDAEAEVLSFRTGQTQLTVYRSDFAGSNKANAVNWEMKGDLVETVQALRDQGVAFEQYDFPGMTYTDGVHEEGQVKLAWFKDPSGNILHLVEGM